MSQFEDSSEVTNNYRINALETILMTYAPSSDAIHIIRNMRKDSTIKDYVMALADGLLYGNWPWCLNRNIAGLKAQSESRTEEKNKYSLKELGINPQGPIGGWK